MRIRVPPIRVPPSVKTFEAGSYVANYRVIEGIAKNSQPARAANEITLRGITMAIHLFELQFVREQEKCGLGAF